MTEGEAMSEPETAAGRETVAAYPMLRTVMTRRVLAIEAEAGAEARAAALDAVDDHVPSGGEGMDGYGYVSCSCGWFSDSYEPPLTWTEHIHAAIDALRRDEG